MPLRIWFACGFCLLYFSIQQEVHHIHFYVPIELLIIAAFPLCIAVHLVKLSPGVGIYLVLLGAGLLSVVYSVEPSRSLVVLGRKALFWGWALLIATYVCRRAAYHEFLIGQAIAATVLTLYLAVRLMTLGVSHAAANEMGMPFYHNYGQTGTVQSLCFFSTVYWILTMRSLAGRCMLGGILLLQVFEIAIAGSRGALIGFISALILLAWTYRSQIRDTFSARGFVYSFTALSLLVIAYIFGNMPEYVDRVRHGLDYFHANNMARLNKSLAAMIMLIEKPFTGVGLGMYSAEYWRVDLYQFQGAYFDVVEFSDDMGAHSIFFERFAEGGLLFGSVFLYLVGRAFLTPLRTLRVSRPERFLQFVCMRCAILSYVIHGLVNSFPRNPMIQLTFLGFLFILYLQRVYMQRVRVGPSPSGDIG